MLGRIVNQAPSTMQNNATLPMLQFHESGSFTNPSSHESMFGNHHNTTPQVNLVPSTNKKLSIVNVENQVALDDIIFVINDMSWVGASNRSTDMLNNKNETPLVTIQMLNALIVKAARSDLDKYGHIMHGGFDNPNENGCPRPNLPDTKGFWQSPSMVADWASLLGVATSPYKQPGLHNSDACDFVPVQVARRSTTKNAFFSVSAGHRQWTVSGVTPLVVQFSLERVQLVPGGATFPIVFVSLLALDDPEMAMVARRLSGEFGPENRPRYVSNGGARRKCFRETDYTNSASDERILFTQSSNGEMGTDIESSERFKQHPLGDPKNLVIRQLGMTIHSTYSSPKAEQCIRAVLNKSTWDNMQRVGVYLGVY